MAERGKFEIPRAHQGSWRSRGSKQGRPGRGRGTGPFHNNVAPSLNSGYPSSDTQTSVSRQRRFDLIASVSRSSGLEKDGDDLKNYKTQEEYRKFIQEKANDIARMHILAAESEERKKQRVEKQENLLILFRKLREGVSSSSRTDSFALEVYETSLNYSILFNSPKQTISVTSHLFPSEGAESSSSPRPALPPPSIYSVLISLLHSLVVFYPSQRAYRQLLASMSETLLPRKSEVYGWLYAVCKSTRTGNYARFASLTHGNVLSRLLPPFQSTETADLSLRATLFIVDAYKRKVAETTWGVIRSSYRELWCDQTSMQTKAWLEATLSLGSGENRQRELSLEGWLEEKSSLGHIVRKKDGAEGRWTLCKPR